VANLGFLSEEQKNNIWGLPRQTAFIDSGQATNLVQPEQVSTEPQLLTDAVSSALNPNLKSKADQAQKVYQEAVQKALPYGNEYAGYLQFYKNQADRFQNEYDTAYGNAMQSAVGDVLQKAKPKNTAEAYAALSRVLPDPDDYKKYAEPYLEMMGLGKPTSGKQDVKRFTFSDGKKRRRGYSKLVDDVPRYFFENGDAVPEGWKVQSITSDKTTTISDPLRKTREQLAIEKKVTDAVTLHGPESTQALAAQRELDTYLSYAKSRSGAATGDKVPTAFQDEAFLLNLRKDLNNLTEGTPEYELAAEELQTYENAYTNQLWENASTQRREWSKTVGEFSYTSDLINRMFTQLNDPSVTTGALATGLGFFEGLASQAKQGFGLAVESFKDAEGEPILAPGTLNAAELYDWGDAAELSGAFKANITDLAYALARMAEPGGRLSTPDVQNQIDRIAPQGRMSKSGIARALLEIDESLQRRLRSQYAGLKASNLPVDDFKFPRGRLEQRSFTNPQTGQQFHALVYNTNKQVKNAKGEMEDGYAVVLQWPVED
tara:strand:+ start:3734 stop:5371 length:1638 start_codon:yes stop_codon:yes gene_type:complete